jgi:cytoskeletal protein RodZ
MLNSDTRNRRAVSTEDVARLLEQHGHTGALLCAVREARGMTLQELADNTRISVRYLEAIEQDDHGALPSATFVRGYVREMAKQLRLHDPGLVDGYLRRMAE